MNEVGQVNIQGVRVTVSQDATHIGLEVKKGWYKKFFILTVGQAQELVEMLTGAISRITEGGDTE